MKHLWWRTKWFFADLMLGLRIRLARMFYWLAKRLDYLVDADEYLEGYTNGLSARRRLASLNEVTDPADDPEQAKENFYKAFPGHPHPDDRSDPAKTQLEEINWEEAEQFNEFNVGRKLD